MPTSQPDRDNAKPRLRGDMYRRAEERYRAETVAELTGILTPADPGVYDAAPIGANAIPAPAASPAVGMTTVTTIAPLPVTTVTVEPAVEPVEPAESTAAAPDAMPVSKTAPPVMKPAPKVTLPRPRERTRRALIPATALATIAVASAFGIAGIVWPSNDAKAPASTQSKPTASAAGPAAPGPAITTIETVRDAEATPRDLIPTGTAFAASSPPVAAAPRTPPAPVAVAPASGRPGLQPRRETQQADSAPTTRRNQPVQQARQTTGSVVPVRSSEGQLRITSTPSGARVTVNGIGWGQTPVTIGHLPLGTKTVRVTYDGYASQQRVVELNGGSALANLHVALQRQ